MIDLSKAKSQIVFCMFSIIMFIIGPFTCLADETASIATGVLHGTITDNETSKPIADVRIEAGNFVTYSESNGYFRFSFIPEGTYNIAVIAHLYKLRLVRDIYIKENKTFELNLSLKRNHQPLVYTGSASMITCKSAMFNGSVHPNGYPTTAFFEYGRSRAYGMKTRYINAGRSLDPVSVNIAVDRLVPETTYHYRLVALNNDGTTYGKDQTFVTDVPILDITQFSAIALPSGKSIIRPFTIRNMGCGPLDFHLTVSDAYALSPNQSNKTFSGIVIPEISDGTIDAGLSRSIAFTYTAKSLPYGDYQVDLAIDHNALNYPNPLVLHIPIQITSPKITVLPKQFKFVVQKGNIKKDSVTIVNTGNTDLKWHMNVRGQATTHDRYPLHYYMPRSKDDIDDRTGSKIANHYGGPDRFGYMWSDNHAESGPAYDWVEISRSGERITNIKDDAYVGPFDIGFSFPFYGHHYDHFYVSSNGFIGFGPSTDYASHSNMPIPAEKTPNSFIAALWDDLSPDDGAIYYYSRSNKLIVQFEKMKKYPQNGLATFQIILDPNGSIHMQYKTIHTDFNTNSCTVGIENNDGSDGLEVAFNINYLQEKMAIRFEPNRCAWLKIYQSPAGQIPPSKKIDVAIGADTTYLAMDHYECSLIVTSDDILTPTITIPVSLDVVESTPVIDVYPDQLTFELMENEQDLKKLSIINQGSNPLVWNMTTSCQPDEKNTYSWIDSDMPGGPIFDWIDITKNGKPINNLKDDSFAGPFPIGFSFSFYGETYEKFYVASNGLIAFGASTGLSERSNDAIPEKRAPNNFLAWFWDDLIPRNARVFYKTLDEKLIVSFIDYGQFGNTGTVTAQVILYVDGSIVYQYQHFRDGFKSSTATIGIENKQGTEGVQVAKNVPYLHDLHAIRFQSDPCQWLNIAPVSGTISSMSTESVAVQASAKDMPQGKYNAILQINSNDKAHNPIDIPVHLIVKGQSHPPVIKSEILSPKSKDMIYATTFPIKGTATATEQETIERVEISFDSGTTWKVATGKNQWRYEWTVPSESGKYSICVRAVGHSGDYQTELTQVQVNVIQRSTSRVLIDGRTMSVNDNIFQIKGVGYAPTPIGHDPETQTPYGDYFTKNYNKIHTRDFPLLRVMGANTLRLLHWDPTADHTHFLDNAFNNGIDPIFVIPGFWINSGYNIDPNSPSNHRNQIKEDFLDMVRIHMNHPAILMWCIGNELNADWMYGKELDHLFSLINEMALAAKNLEGRTYHPTTTALIDINLSNTIKGFNSKVPDIAAWGATVYRGDSFGELFTDFSKISDKPLIILGFGIDALNNKTLKEYETDGLSKQSEYARALWREINQNKHICPGASITAYADEWWKGKNASDPLCKDDDPSLHGFCGYASDAHPDGYANEEWWGIVRVIKNGQDSDIVQPRSVYYELQTAWNFNPIPPKEYKIVPKDCNRSDNFGRSVSIYGKYAVGGAKGDDTNGGNSGAVYMMHFNGENWVKTSKLSPEDGKVNDYFGCSVGLFDDFALFGAYGKDGPGSKSGAAYIFALKSSGWEEYQKLVADDADANDYFGYAVDIHENYAIIGAYGDDDKGNMSGAAYIFKRQADNTWVQQQKLLDDRGDRNDQFGYAVDICDTHAIVGAYRDDDKGDSSGSAIIFKREQNMWIQQARLNARDGQSNDYFGFDVAISKDYAAVGAYRSDDEPRYNIGSVYIFKHDKGIWNHQAKIVPNDGSSNDYFGSAVDMIGSRLLIGAYGDGDKGPSSGAAYLYCLDQDEWKFQKKYIANKGKSYDYFGYDVAIGEQGLIMGAYGADDQGGMSGAVYIFGQGDDDSDTDNWMNAMPSFSRKHHRQTLHDSPFFQRMTSSQLNAISNTKQKIETNIIPISSNAKISIEIINLPPIGSRLQDLEGQVRPYSSEKNAVQVAIFVNDQWRLKPGMNRMDGFSISDNGLFSCDITTAPDDHLATKIAVLVVPVSAMPLDIRSIEHYPALGRMIIER